MNINNIYICMYIIPILTNKYRFYCHFNLERLTTSTKVSFQLFFFI